MTANTQLLDIIHTDLLLLEFDCEAVIKIRRRVSYFRANFDCRFSHILK